MADRLTQLQDCLDQLAKQMYATLMYTITRSVPSNIQGQPPMSDLPDKNAPLPSQTHSIQQSAPQSTQPDSTQPDLSAQQAPPERPHSPPLPDGLRELSRDLILKTAQIEAIIASLPGIGTSEATQVAHLERLQEELLQVAREREEAVRERERLARVLDQVLGGVRRW